MPTDAEIESKFWKALKSDMTVMLGLACREDCHTQPMTAQFEDSTEGGPIWFFTAKDNTLVKTMGEGHAAVAHFASKGHDLFATLHGRLVLDNDRTTIDHLWNSFIAAWFKGGKDDPQLQLLRFEPDSAQIWLNENSLFAGIRMLLGHDPKKDYKAKVAKVALG